MRESTQAWHQIPRQILFFDTDFKKYMASSLKKLQHFSCPGLMPSELYGIAEFVKMISSPYCAVSAP